MLSPELHRTRVQAPEDDPPPPYYSRRDRGPSPFFHGREEVRNRFATVLSDMIGTMRGTTFLIQGPPGAGKSALLDKLCEEAEGWEAATIGSQELYNPAVLAQSMDRDCVLNREAAAKIGIKFLEAGVAEQVAGHASPKEILRHLAPESGLILMLDEAQKMKNLSQNRSVAIDTLDAIHNGELGKPVVLLTAGLGTSEDVYKSPDVSRFARGCTEQLGRLNKEAEEAVIHDWLMKAGGATGDLSAWINAIASRTHGWPQHIISYTDPANEYLKANQGCMTDEGLQLTLKKGEQERVLYYEARVKGISKRKRQVLARIFAHLPLDSCMEEEDLIDALKEEYTHEEAEKLFEDLLARGVLAERPEGDYGIPIPSFHTWLVNEYAKDSGKGGGSFAMER